MYFKPQPSEQSSRKLLLCFLTVKIETLKVLFFVTKICIVMLLQKLILLQKGIMEVLFEIFQLKEPEWTDDFHLALLSVGKGTKHNSSVIKFNSNSNFLFNNLTLKIHVVPDTLILILFRLFMMQERKFYIIFFLPGALII